MARLWQQITKGEKGQALVIVLALLVVGGLLVAPSLNYAATSLNAGRIVKQNVKGIYAADAGIEDALWKLKNDPPAPAFYPLPEPVNQMEVTIETEEKEEYALYYGDLIVVGEPPQNFPDYLAVDGKMEWVEEEGAYEYTITVTWQPWSGDPVIMLDEIGVRLPAGYSYQSGSADSFGDNLSDDEPEDKTDGAGAQMLNWVLGTPPPQVSQWNTTATQTFYVTGEGGQDGDYTWIKAVPMDIGQVGEIIGTLYRITATATRPGDEPTAKVRAYVLKEEVEEEVEVVIHIITWQINPQ